MGKGKFLLKKKLSLMRPPEGTSVYQFAEFGAFFIGLVRQEENVR
jgi:hypothetical protein